MIIKKDITLKEMIEMGLDTEAVAKLIAEEKARLEGIKQKEAKKIAAKKELVKAMYQYLTIIDVTFLGESELDRFVSEMEDSIVEMESALKAMTNVSDMKSILVDKDKNILKIFGLK